jgi:transposase-like protein
VRRINDSDGWRLVIISFTPEGKRRRLAIADSHRESKDSWVEVLLDLK